MAVDYAGIQISKYNILFLFICKIILIFIELNITLTQIKMFEILIFLSFIAINI